MSERFVWIGPVRHIGGYGEVARGYLEGLVRAGAEVVAVDSDGPVGAPDAVSLAAIAPLLAGGVRERGATCVYHAAPGQLGRLLEFFPMPQAARRVACTIAETDRIPAQSVTALEPFDEVWVPAAFQRETFARSGVPRERLRVVPYGVDTRVWQPAARRAAAAGESDPFRFLYCFQLGWRKGFDLLLEAYLSEFSRADDVELVLKVLGAPPGGPARGALAASVADRIDLFADDLPRVRIVDDELGRAEMCALYQGSDLYVSTDRANGWGMPCHEAMACGTACATIDWSGSTEFMHEDNALLIAPGELVAIDPRLVASAPELADDRWPAVEVAAVRAVLRWAFDDQAGLAKLGARAAADIREHWSLERAARGILERNTLEYRPRPGLLDKLLPSFGLQAPSALLAEARTRALLCSFRPLRDDWRVPLAAYLERFRASDDVTLCLWADCDGEDASEELALAIQEAVVAHGLGDDTPDLQLTFAPRDHVPWQRVEVDPAYCAPPLAAADRAA